MMAAPVGQADAVQVLPGAVAVPDAHTLRLEQVGIRAAADEPEQLLHHTCHHHDRCMSQDWHEQTHSARCCVMLCRGGAEMTTAWLDKVKLNAGSTSPEGALGGEERESVPQVEAHLAAEFGEGARPRPVSAEYPVADDVIHEIQILRHATEKNTLSSITCQGLQITCSRAHVCLGFIIGHVVGRGMPAALRAGLPVQGEGLERCCCWRRRQAHSTGRSSACPRRGVAPKRTTAATCPGSSRGRTCRTLRPPRSVHGNLSRRSCAHHSQCALTVLVGCD